VKLPFVSASVEDLVLEVVTKTHANAMADLHATLFSRPWSDGEFLELLQNTGVGGFVLRGSASKGSAIVGFVLTRTVADEIEILTIGVASNWQVLGAGRRLMDAVLQCAYRDRLQSVFLEVNENNGAALALYRKLGFLTIASRSGYYQQQGDKRAAALVMRRDLR